MSASGQMQTSRDVRVMSVIALKADIDQSGLHIRLVPLADCSHGSVNHPKLYDTATGDHQRRVTDVWNTLEGQDALVIDARRA
jgi:hypothetical protein